VFAGYASVNRLNRGRRGINGRRGGAEEYFELAFGAVAVLTVGARPWDDGRAGDRGPVQRVPEPGEEHVRAAERRPLRRRPEREQLELAVLLQVGQHPDEGADALDVKTGHVAEGALEVVGGQGDLLEVVLALHAGGGLADLLDGGQQQTNQDGDDRDHDEQFDQREPPRPRVGPVQT